MAPLNNPLKYLPAQYVFVSFLSKEVGGESHPFTLTSIMDDGMLEICVKEIGDFTKKLGNLTVGTKVKVWGPFGSFSKEFLKDQHDQVWIGGGIGVTPFLGMLSHHAQHPTKTNKWFFYCCRSREEASFDSVIMEKAHNHNINLIEHYSDNQGYLTVDFFKEHLPSLKNKKFLICGPTIMKSLVVDFLIKDGVNPKDIIQEDFVIR
jgi:predicted ferric reductase